MSLSDAITTQHDLTLTQSDVKELISEYAERAGYKIVEGMPKALFLDDIKLKLEKIPVLTRGAPS